MSATPLVIEPEQVDLSDALGAATPFADLPAPVLKAISDIAEERQYLTGEAVFALGQFDGSELFVVKSGRLKAAFADPQSGSMLIEEVVNGGFFGLADALAGEESPRAEMLTLTAEEDTDVIAIDAASFRAVVSQRPSLTRNLMHYFAQSIAGAGFGAAPAEASPERRVFAALMEYVERDAINGDWRIPRMPKHREIAEKAGADDAAAASAVAQLIQDGIAHRDYPGLIISDMARLSQLAN